MPADPAPRKCGYPWTACNSPTNHSEDCPVKRPAQESVEEACRRFVAERCRIGMTSGHWAEALSAFVTALVEQRVGEALNKYGKHRLGCKAPLWGAESCDCGLDALRSRPGGAS